MKLRGAIIGCGFFAHNHINAWKDLAEVEIVAACDASGDRAAAFAARFGIARHYDDAESMLSREKPDFADIVTTVDSHRPLVELAARHGVPAICQKPFADQFGDAEAMVAACARAGVPLMVHENFRWQAPLMEVARELEAGSIGTPFFGRVSFRHDYDVYKNQPYLAQAERFAILDVGIHVLDVARFYFGEVKRLSATTQRINPDIRGEDTATMLLEHESGVTSIVDCCFYSHLDPNPFPETLIEVEGSVGSIRLAAGYNLRTTSNGRSVDRIVDAEVSPWMERPWHVVQDSVRNVQRHWIDCLRSGREPATSGRDNLKTLALGFAAYNSAANGTAVKIAAQA